MVEKTRELSLAVTTVDESGGVCDNFRAVPGDVWSSFEWDVGARSGKDGFESEYVVFASPSV